MYFQQFYLTCLSHASYMLASEGVACVVDPQRDVIPPACFDQLAVEHSFQDHQRREIGGRIRFSGSTPERMDRDNTGHGLLPFAPCAKTLA